MKKLAGLCAALAAFGLVACGGAEPQQGTGTIELSIAGPAAQQEAGALKQALVVGAPNLTVASVKVTFTSGAFTRVETPAFVSFPVSYSAYGLPAGSYTVLAQALSASGAVLFEVAENNVPVSDRTVTALNLLMQQVPEAGTVHVQAPYISAIVISNGYPPAINKPVSLSATVVLPSDATSPEYAWTVACAGEPAGEKFSAPAAKVTDLTLAACASDATVTFQASATIPGGGKLASSVSFLLDYDPQGIAGQLTINRWPNITDFVVAGPSMDAQPSPGSRIPAVVAAVDPDGDSLAYMWSSSCGGAFDSVPNQPFAKFWNVPASIGECVLTVTVSDGRGGSATATFTLNVTPSPVLVLAPYVDVCTSPVTCSSVATYADARAFVDENGLHLSKDVVDGNGLLFGPNARIVGVAGMTFQSASFSVVPGSVLAGGSPRIGFSFADGSYCAPSWDNVGAEDDGKTYVFQPGVNGPVTCPTNGVLTDVIIHADFGGQSTGTVTLTNIKVNGISVIP
jgi:hypothetical protein